MNTPSDTRLLDTLRLALSEAAPAAPSPALLATVRREAALRARRRSARRAAFVAAVLAAAAALAFAVIPPGVLSTRHPTALNTTLATTDPATADSALRLLLFDAAEARAALASESADSDDLNDSMGQTEAVAETSSDADALALALLAWQEEPLQGLFDSQTAVF